MEVCRKGNRWWCSFNCTSQPRLYRISWTPRNLELGSYLMDLRLGNVLPQKTPVCQKPGVERKCLCFLERFCWMWVNSACGELSWVPTGTSPGHGPKSCQEWVSPLCVNLLPAGLLILLIPAGILVAELPQVQEKRWSWKLLSNLRHNQCPWCCPHSSWAPQAPKIVQFLLCSVSKQGFSALDILGEVLKNYQFWFAIKNPKNSNQPNQP